MTLTRRSFVAGAAVAALGRALPAGAENRPHEQPGTTIDGGAGASTPKEESGGPSIPDAFLAHRFDPWVEVDPASLHYNVQVVRRLAEGRPVLAVIKNNAYGLGLERVARILEPLPGIAGFAVVKAEAALGLRTAGIEKPILHMGLFGEEGPAMVARDIHLSLTADEAVPRVREAEHRARRAARTHVYLDTGMSRMGVPWHRALPWMEEVSAAGIAVDGTFMAFTEEPDFDREQLRRFQELTRRARERGVDLGRLHAASSNGVFHLPGGHLDMVRPGIALFGAYPTDWDAERAMAQLRPALRFRARVVRVERLRVGDGVSYGHNYVAKRPTWIATLPAGHTDGVPREAVKGQRVLIGRRTYPVIGAVSASHCIVEVGGDRSVEVGDVATLLGPDHPEIHPNRVAEATGRSVYDVLMHLSPTLPRTEGRF